MGLSETTGTTSTLAHTSLAYRGPVIRDPEFRRYISSITSQEIKRSVVFKYEIGLTRWLIQHGHAFDTYISRLYPFHPIYTEWYFRLLDDGFPLLKRFLLSENPIPGTAAWQTGLPVFGRRSHLRIWRCSSAISFGSQTLDSWNAV